MTISYDDIISAFLAKITEFEFMKLYEDERENLVDGYMKRTLSPLRKVSKYTFTTDDEAKAFTDDFEEDDVDELVEIISEGMLVQFLKPYLYKQELLENTLNTSDFSTYSPAELLLRVGNAYAKAQTDYIQMVREYSYNHGDLTDLHL